MNGETGVYHCAAEDLPQATLPMRMRWAADILDEVDDRECRTCTWTADELRNRAADWDRP